jgi:hypothetical protein
MAGLVVLVIWQGVRPGGPPPSRDQLRRKLESPTVPAPPRPVPAAPSPSPPPTERSDRAATLPPPDPTPPLAAPEPPAASPPAQTSPRLTATESARPWPLVDTPAATALPTPRPTEPAAAITAVRPAPPPATRPPGSAVVPPEAAARFAVEFGPFSTAAEAERVERQLGQAGHQTVRFRQQTGAALYAVLIERVPGLGEAEALVTALPEQGFPDAALVGPGPTVRVGEPMVLRGAVQLGERLRAQGYHVRIAAQPGEAITFVIRHGNFAARAEAESRSADLARLGLPNHVVRVR